MHAKRILIPLDLVHSTIDPLVFVQSIAAETPICVTLLHVVGVNLAPAERRVYDELCSEAQVALGKLARLFFDDGQETRLSVRIGRPHQQIIVEARASRAELIILAGHNRRSWARLIGMGTTERVVRAAPCATLVLPCARPAAQFLPSLTPAQDAEASWQDARAWSRQALESRFEERTDGIPVLGNSGQPMGR